MNGFVRTLLSLILAGASLYIFYDIWEQTFGTQLALVATLVMAVPLLLTIAVAK